MLFCIFASEVVLTQLESGRCYDVIEMLYSTSHFNPSFLLASVFDGAGKSLEPWPRVINNTLSERSLQYTGR